MTYLTDLYDNLVVHMDFYENPDIIPLCGMTVTDTSNRILGQLWLRNPRLDEEDAMDRMSDVLNYMFEQGLHKAKKPRKFALDTMDGVVMEGLAYVAQLVNAAEEDSTFRSLIPAPLWASQDIYTPPQEHDILDLE